MRSEGLAQLGPMGFELLVSDSLDKEAVNDDSSTPLLIRIGIPVMPGY